MMSFLRSAFVVGRRDFVATVYSRTFLIFLAGPLLCFVVFQGEQRRPRALAQSTSWLKGGVA